MPRFVSVLQNCGCLRTSKPYISLVFFYPFLHRSPCFPDVSIWKEVKFIDRDAHWYTRKVKGAIHIRLHPNNINTDSEIEIPIRSKMVAILLCMTAAERLVTGCQDELEQELK